MNRRQQCRRLNYFYTAANGGNRPIHNVVTEVSVIVFSIFDGPKVAEIIIHEFAAGGIWLSDFDHIPQLQTS